MRSCYRSEWYLFRDAPNVKTRGRYYRCPPDTPFYPGSHNLGSRVWHDGNWTHVVELGESIDAKHSWDTGMRPAVLPLNQREGDVACIAGGELLANQLTPAQQDDGYPLACYIPHVPDLPEWHRIASIWRCPIQKFYAQVLELLYDGNAGPALFAARVFFGGIPTITYHDGTALLPPLLTVVCAEYVAVIISGTANYQQLALQAFMSIQGPQNYGSYSTNPQWYIASQWVHEILLAEGVTNDRPIMLAGHSYGACAALNIAARYRFASSTRRIRYITFGTPKPGDIRMVELLKLCEGVDMVNTGDLVAVLPPGPLVLNPVYAQLLLPQLLFWTEWEFPPNLLLTFADGTLQINQPPTIDSFTLLAFTLRALANQQLDQIFTHHIAVYVERIALRCPGGEIPASGAIGMGVTSTGVAGKIGLADKRPIAAFGKLGMRSDISARGQLGLGAPAIAGGSVGFAFHGAGGQLGLTSGEIASAQRFGLGVPAIAGGSVGFAFHGAGGQLGLGVASAQASGQLGLGVAQFAMGQLGLQARTAFMARGCVVLGFSGIPGQLGLKGFDVAQGSLGLTSSAQLRSGQLGLTVGYLISEGSLGLQTGTALTIYWDDTFTDANGTALTSHTGEFTPGGYTNVSGTYVIESNKLTVGTHLTSTSFSSFDPAQTAFTATVKFKIAPTSIDSHIRAARFQFRRDITSFIGFEVRIIFASGDDTTSKFTLAKQNPMDVQTWDGTGTLNSDTEYVLTVIVTSTTVDVTINGVNVNISESTYNTQTRMALKLDVDATITATTSMPYWDDLLVTS